MPESSGVEGAGGCSLSGKTKFTTSLEKNLRSAEQQTAGVLGRGVEWVECTQFSWQDEIHNVQGKRASVRGTGYNRRAGRDAAILRLGMDGAARRNSRRPQRKSFGPQNSVLAGMLESSGVEGAGWMQLIWRNERQIVH
jgi:hypothetical protein